MSRRIHVLMWFLLSPGIVLPACGTARKQLPVVPVAGDLFFQGKPAVGAMIVLHPTAGSAPASEWTAGYPRAIVAPDGSFRVCTYGIDDGAPEGEYLVLVQWQQSTPEAESEDDEVAFTDRLQRRYADPNKSKLRATILGPLTQLPRFDID